MTKKITPMHEYDANETRVDYINRMVSEGFFILEPLPTELLLDLDTEEHFELFKKQSEVFYREFEGAEDPIIYPSRNGLPGRHVLIETGRKMHHWERIAWQASLGSDPMRELLSSIRLECGDDKPTILVETLENMMTVQKKRYNS